MKVPAVLVLLISTTLAAAAATLSKQDEFLDAVHTSTRRESKHKIVEELLKNTEVDPSVNDNEPFLYAVRNDDFFVAQLLLNDDRVNPAAKDNAAIRIAASRRNYSMVILLLSSGRVDPTAKGDTPIGTAIVNEDTLMIKLLLDDYRMVKTELDAKNILTFAVKKFKGNTKPLEFLMDHPKFSSGLVSRLFFPAVVENKLELVKWLMSQPTVDPTADNYWALFKAVRLGQHDMVKSFLEHPKVDVGFNRNLFLVMAISMRDHRMFEIVLNNEKANPNDRDGLFLMTAVELGDYFMVERLLSKMENPSGNGNIALRLALKKKDLKMIKMLLSHQNIDVKIPIYYPPIYIALETGDLEIVKALVEHAKFCESTTKEMMMKSIQFAQNQKHVEIADYLKTINVTGDPKCSSRALPNPAHQLACRMIILEELVFWHARDCHAEVTPQIKREALLSKLNSLLADLFPGAANSPQLGSYSQKPCFELLKLTFSDFQTYNGSKINIEQSKDAFRKFVTEKNWINAELNPNAYPADLKRKREEGEAIGGEQEPISATGETSSSGMPDRNVRRRMNEGSDSRIAEADKEEEV